MIKTARLILRLAGCTLGLLALVVLAGCASTEVTNNQQLVNEMLPYPGHIWVYDFAATSAEVPACSALAGQAAAPATPPTAGQIAVGRRLGIALAAELVGEIQNMGLLAQRASSETRLQANDIVIRGYLLSIDEGSVAKRITIGFGYGSSQLTTAVEGYQMTAHGLRKLESSTIKSGGSKTPGEALSFAGFIATAHPVGLIVSSGVKVYAEASGYNTIKGRAEATAKEIANQLKILFQQQGWIQQQP